MRISSLVTPALAFVAAGGLCVIVANTLVGVIEDQTEISVRAAFDNRSFGWAEVQANGLQVIVSGTAPTEARRFSAISAAGTVVDSARVIDRMDVTPTEDITPPRFSIEVLRNDSGISVSGLIPAETNREALLDRLQGIAGDAEVSDLLQSADFPTPQGWNLALEYALNTLDRLPRSKISMDSGNVAVTAIAETLRDKQIIEAQLSTRAPHSVDLTLAISAPRPVITPFSLRLVIDENGPRFDACSADTEDTRQSILTAASEIGLQNAACILGLGVPSPRWGEAATQAIGALGAIGGGSVTFSDADVTLIAAQGTSPNLFDRVVGELDAALPEVFALHAVLPKTEEGGDGGPPEFVATRSPEGLVQLRGRLTDENLRFMADSYAKSRFGSDDVYTATRISGDLPFDWAERVLAGLEALTYLKQGAVTVAPDTILVKGISQRLDATAAISGLLSQRLGAAQGFTLDVAYQEPPPPRDIPPTPEECEARLQTVQVDSKITFEPGSATIEEGSLGLMNRLAEILGECGNLRLEIQGHTDSQGRESMNLELSQARANAVLQELRARRVATSNFSAVGYGETLPIETNRTEEGREANRRIEFRLIRPKPTVEVESALDSLADESSEGAEN